MYTYQTNRIRRSATKGAILVWFVLIMPLLLGMTGLVIDAGLLMSSSRHVQTSVDAAALAAARVLADGKTLGEANRAVTEFVKGHNDLADATIKVFMPPRDGLYAGEDGYVEVTAELETSTFFIHLLPGGSQSKIATARAVAGGEKQKTIDGIVALDPNAKPGIRITGNANISVSGRIIVNSEGGGVDSAGGNVSGSGVAAFVSPFGLVKATEVHVVGGANRPDRFENYELGGKHPLVAGQLPVPDPFISLPVPTISNGVLNVDRGAAVATNDSLELYNPNDSPRSPNSVVTDPVTGEETMHLRPGIYTSISIDGGRVRFDPGIYVLAATPDDLYSLDIKSGDVVARGIMFYNTVDEYDPVTGLPDAADGDNPPALRRTSYGNIRLNAGVGFTGIDTSQPDYDYSSVSRAISEFDGMLIYQRRRHTSLVQVQGVADAGGFVGAVYAKWSQFRLPAGGVFDSQIVVGNLFVPGHGDIKVNYDKLGAISAVGIYLVE